jgi:hypothetical protein
MADYVREFFAGDPEMLRFLAEQDQRFAGGPVEQRRQHQSPEQHRSPERDQGEEARIREIVAPMVAESEERLRREFRSLARRARLRRWDRSEIDRYIASKPASPEGT